MNQSKNEAAEPVELHNSIVEVGESLFVNSFINGKQDQFRDQYQFLKNRSSE